MCIKTLFENQATLIVLGSLLSIIAGIATTHLTRFGILKFWGRYQSYELDLATISDGMGGQLSTDTVLKIPINVSLEISNSSLNYKAIRDVKFLISASRKKILVDVFEKVTPQHDRLISSMRVNPQDIIVKDLFFYLPDEFWYEKKLKIKACYKTPKGSQHRKTILCMTNPAENIRDGKIFE